MSLPNVTMQPAAGLTVPTVVFLPDGTSVFPVNGQITITTNFIAVMIAAGWELVVASGTTHVP
jgi:hypothetical protein